MYRLKTSAEFDSAHFLAGYNGKCANIHGHRWKIEVVVKSSELTAGGEKRGMVVDFADFKRQCVLLQKALTMCLFTKRVR